MSQFSRLPRCKFFPPLQNAMADLQCELCSLRTQFEGSLNSHEDAKRRLSEQVREFSQQRERAQQEVRRGRGAVFAPWQESINHEWV